jgi:glycosyltransferase involved in cell wall biosynthesis
MLFEADSERHIRPASAPTSFTSDMRRRASRILLTADPFFPVPPPLYGGIERIVASLCDEYCRQGLDVGLVALPGSTADVDAFYPWARGPDRLSGPISWWHQQATLTSAIRAFKPHVVHSFSRLAYLGRHLCSRLPKVMSYQRHPDYTTTKWAGRLAGRSLTFTGCSGHITQTGSRSGGTWRSIPNFVDLEKFDFVPEVAADAPLVFLSRLEEIKGVHNAIAMALKAGHRLLIAGNRVDSPGGQQYWKDHIEPFIGRDGIEYVGPVGDAEKNVLLGQAAAMIVPIEWDEPFGIVFVEALACGTPVISTPRGSVTEIIEHGKHGFVVRSVEEGVNAIARLGMLSRRSCREHVERHFALPVVAQRYLSLYDEMLALEPEPATRARRA